MGILDRIKSASAKKKLPAKKIAVPKNPYPDYSLPVVAPANSTRSELTWAYLLSNGITVTDHELQTELSAAQVAALLQRCFISRNLQEPLWIFREHNGKLPYDCKCTVCTSLKPGPKEAPGKPTHAKGGSDTKSVRTSGDANKKKVAALIKRKKKKG